MANLKLIKNKMNSIKNLKKITKALEIVSTIKLQKTKHRTESLKAYLLDLLFILNTLGDTIDVFQENKQEKRNKLSIIITSEKGLCGSLNSKLMRKVAGKLSEKRDDIFTVGKKGLDYFSRSGFNIVGSISLDDNFKDKDLLPLYEYLKSAIDNHKYSKITLYFNYFKNSLFQIPTSVQVFPMTQERFQEFAKEIGMISDINFQVKPNQFTIEPNKKDYLREVHRQIRSYIILSVIVQNKTGEHASRMIAMKNANDNSTAMLSKLDLAYNKERQANITQEISEIVSTKIAMED